MKSDFLKKLLRALVTVLGVGLGSVLAYVCVQVNSMAGQPPMTVDELLVMYAVLAILLGTVAYLIAPRVIDSILHLANAAAHRMDQMTPEQLIGSISGFVGGLIVAALLSQLVMLMGASMFTVAMCAILFLVFGVMGGTLGLHRAADFKHFFLRFTPHGKKSISFKKNKIKTAVPKLLDDTVLIDGRIAEVCRAGFLEGTILLSGQVEKELARLAESEDEASRIRGRRGQETVRSLEETLRLKRISQSSYATLNDALMGEAKKYHAALVTCDSSAAQLAEKNGVRVMNLNDLACMLRPAVVMGDVLTAHIVKAGREANQGVSYLQDGSMVVVEGGRTLVGKTVQVEVTSVLQTNAGRMIFARVKAEE